MTLTILDYYLIYLRNALLRILKKHYHCVHQQTVDRGSYFPLLAEDGMGLASPTILLLCWILGVIYLSSLCS